MKNEIKGILLISFLLAIFSFIFSLLANVLLDAIIRSLIVLVISFLILLGAFKLLQVITKSNTFNAAQQAGISADEQNIDKEQQVSQISNQSDESLKGGHIDLLTPEDNQFEPFRPQELSKQND